MNLLERVLTLLGANLNTVVEKADDPEKVLRQLQLDMRNQMVQVKTQVATAIAESHKLKKRVEERKGEATSWQRKAEQAVQHGNDDAARTALQHLLDVKKQIQRYEQQQKDQEQFIVTMRGALRQLEAKTSEVETTIDLLVTQRRNALIQQRVFEALNKSGGSKEQEKAAKARDAVIEAQARARALAEMRERNLDSQLSQITEEQLIEQQLQDLKDQQVQVTETERTRKKERSTAPLPNPQISGTQPPRKRGRPPRSEVTTETSLQEIDIEQIKKLLDTPQG